MNSGDSELLRARLIQLKIRVGVLEAGLLDSVRLHDCLCDLRYQIICQRCEILSELEQAIP